MMTSQHQRSCDDVILAFHDISNVIIINYFLLFMYSKRAARNKLYSTVSMTPGDENVQFSSDEGILCLTTPSILSSFIF